jgi:hypothetical protein
MRRTRDLFDEAARVMELQPDLRTKLAPLLSVLLAEAAGAKSPQTNPQDRGGEERGHDQDRA